MTAALHASFCDYFTKENADIFPIEYWYRLEDLAEASSPRLAVGRRAVIVLLPVQFSRGQQTHGFACGIWSPAILLLWYCTHKDRTMRGRRLDKLLRQRALFLLLADCMTAFDLLRNETRPVSVSI